MATSKANALKKKAQQAAEQTSAAATHITVAEDERDEREAKKPVSFFVTPSNYQRLQSLARFRTAFGGKSVSIGSLIDDSIAEYLERHREELATFDSFAAKLGDK